jgi:hypothetical protein
VTPIEDAAVAGWMVRFVGTAAQGTIDDITEAAWLTPAGRVLLCLFSDALIEFVLRRTAH